MSAVDISPELIDLAKKKGGGNIRYSVSPAHKLFFLSDGSMDKAVVVLALQNIKEVREALKEVGRVLKPLGSLFIVLNHPSFRVPKDSSWGYD